MFWPYLRSMRLFLDGRDKDGVPQHGMLDPALHPDWLELACYLGERFCFDWVNATDAELDAEFAHYPSATAFYQHSQRYLYHLTAYFLEGWKRPGYAMLLNGTAGCKGPLVLDYGCGIGADGLWLLEEGFRVSFADLASESLAYCRWRLERHLYLHAPVYVLPDDAMRIPLHDVVWCMDVLEHLPATEHEAFLEQLAGYGHAVIMNLVEDATATGGVHWPVDTGGLLAYIRARWRLVLTQEYYAKPDGSKVTFVLFTVDHPKEG